MKPNPLLLAFAGAFSFSALAVDPVAPEPFPSSRYDKLAGESPFRLATPEQKPPEVVQGWASRLSINGVGVVQNGEGKDVPWVAVAGEQKELFSLSGNEPGKDGISIDRIEWSDHLKTKVILKKGNEFATLVFDQAQLTQQAPPPGGPVPNPARPGTPGTFVQPNKPGVARPTQTIPPPRVVGPYSSPTGMPRATGAAAPTPPSSSTNSIRRRIPPIGSPTQ